MFAHGAFFGAFFGTLGLGILSVVGLRLVDVIAKNMIDGQITDILGVESRVGGVSLGVLTSNTSFTDVTIKNPSGFDYEYILTVDRASLDCGVGTLLSSDIEIPRMVLHGLTFDLEEIEIPFPHMTLAAGKALGPIPVKMVSQASTPEQA